MIKKGTAFWAAVILIPVACSVENHYRTLSFFFDGVPNPEEENLIAAADSVNAGIPDSSAVFAQVAKPELVIHQPYLEKECSICHDQERIGSLSESQPALCYTCHTSFSELYEFEHGPSVGGYCTECHNPHRAMNENLLVRTGQDLCLDCHGSKQFFESTFHDNSDELVCVTCHNPHGSNEHSLLNQGTCNLCHDSFTDKYTVLHGPVASGHCSLCHIPHHKGSEKLLVHQDRELCFYCHDAFLLMQSETHSYLEDTNCTECHNPHGGEERYIFN